MSQSVAHIFFITFFGLKMDLKQLGSTLEHRDHAVFFV